MKRLDKYIMKHLSSYEEFVNRLTDLAAGQALKNRRAMLVTDLPLNQYAIQVTVDIDNAPELLLEHEQYKKFAKTNNRYSYHPENPDIPVKAHYHVYPPNSKKELYAVNVDDGKAHHKSNRGITISKKEADELRKLGVKIPDNNLLEARQIQSNTNAQTITVFIYIDEE